MLFIVIYIHWFFSILAGLAFIGAVAGFFTPLPKLDTTIPGSREIARHSEHTAILSGILMLLSILVLLQTLPSVIESLK